MTVPRSKIVIFIIVSCRAGLFASADFQNPETSAGFNPKAASDSSVVIISTLPFSLTGSRGEYLRVAGILEMVE